MLLDTCYQYKHGDIVYFIGDEYNEPHLCTIVALWNEYPNECRLDTIGNQGIEKIRPFNTYGAIRKTYQE